MYVLENRPANKILYGGRDMFNRIKIDNGLKVTNNDIKEESKLKHGNIPEKNDSEFDLGPNDTPTKFKHENIPVINDPEYYLGPYSTPKRFKPDSQHVHALEELVKLFLEKKPHKDSSCYEKVVSFFMMHRKNDPLRKKLKAQEKKLETQEKLNKKMQDEITYIRNQLSKCAGMVARLSSFAPVEVSAPSAPLTLPEFNSNSGHSDTATFPNPNSNEDTNSDKYRRMECKNCLDENVVSEI